MSFCGLHFFFRMFLLEIKVLGTKFFFVFIFLNYERIFFIFCVKMHKRGSTSHTLWNFSKAVGPLPWGSRWFFETYSNVRLTLAAPLRPEIETFHYEVPDTEMGKFLRTTFNWRSWWAIGCLFDQLLYNTGTKKLSVRCQ